MAADVAAVCSPLRSVVHYSLDNHLHANAVFIAERLVAFDAEDEENRRLLGAAYYASGQAATARTVLVGTKSPGCVYLLARCCFDLNRLVEGEVMLRTLLETRPETVTKTAELTEGQFDVRRSQGPDEASILYLLGQFYVKLGRPDQAAEFLSRSAKLNPFLWSAFEALCRLGHPVDVSEYFKPARGNATKRPKLNVADTRAPAADLESKVMEAVRARENLALARKETKVSAKPAREPQLSMAPLTSVSNGENNNRMILAQVVPSRGTGSHGQPAGGHSLRSSGAASAPKRPVVEHRALKQPAQKVPTVVRAASVPAQVKSGAMAPLRDKKRARVVSSSLRTASAPGSVIGKGDPPEVGEVTGPTAEQVAASTHILDLLATLGAAYAHMCQFRCAKALETFGELDLRQRETGWVMTQMGMAEYEIQRLDEAEQRFKRAHEVEPYRLQGMDAYSAVLWALHQDVALSSLAHRLLDHDRRSPVPWVLIATLFSVKKNHQKAISALQRAIRLEPSYAYAHVLLGHEYYDSEDYKKAQLCYRRALQEDPLSYKAWYGLGMIYHHQGCDRLAEVHYRKAVDINPSNALILHSLGTVQKRAGKLYEALKTLQLAVKLNDKYWNTRLVKAAVHTELGDLDAAIAEVAAAKELAPTDGKVYMQMGRLYQHVGRKQDAIDEFGAAAVMDPKVSQAAHEAIEKLDSYDPEENAACSIWEDIFKTIC